MANSVDYPDALSVCSSLSYGTICRGRGDSVSVVSAPRPIPPTELDAIFVRPATSSSKPRGVAAAMAALEQQGKTKRFVQTERSGFGSSIPRFFRSQLHVRGPSTVQRGTVEHGATVPATSSPTASKRLPAMDGAVSPSSKPAKSPQGGEGSQDATRLVGDHGSPTTAGSSPDTVRSANRQSNGDQDGAQAGSTSQHSGRGATARGKTHKGRRRRNASNSNNAAAGKVPGNDKLPPRAESPPPLVSIGGRMNLTPGPGRYNVRTAGRHVAATTVRVEEPERPSSSFIPGPRFRKSGARNPNFVPASLHDREYDAREWAKPLRAHGCAKFARSRRDTLQGPLVGRRPRTGHLFYRPMLEAPTDIGRRIATTPIRYAAGSRTKFKRFPMSQLHPQYSQPVGPGSYEELATQHRTGMPHDPKRGSAVFVSSSSRFKRPKRRELVGDDWSYSLFDHNIQPWGFRDAGVFNRAKRPLAEKL